jgi:sporulation-control protein
MFQKILASVGIGSAKVNTHLHQAAVFPGEMLSGEVHIVGGSVAQTIEEIYLYLATKYKREVNDSTHYEECRLIQFPITQAFSLEPQATQTIPFQFEVPLQTPISYRGQEVYLHTGLDISLAIDPGDTDYLQVNPHPLIQYTLDALQSIGFSLYQVDCEYSHRFGTQYPFVQEFEFKPPQQYRGLLDELEVIFYLQPHQLDVLMIVDRRVRGLSSFFDEALGTDDRYAQVQVSTTDLHQPLQVLAQRLDAAIRQYV